MTTPEGGCRSCARQAREQRRGPSKPHALPPADVIGHRRLLAKNAFGPFARFNGAALGGQEAGVVVLSLRERRGLGDVGEQRARSLALAGLGERVGAEARRALVVVLRIAGGHLL